MRGAVSGPAPSPAPGSPAPESPVRATALIRIARNVPNLYETGKFYIEVLGFHPSGLPEEDAELAELLQVRKALRLRLNSGNQESGNQESGNQEIELTQCFPQGASCMPAAANFVDFQHIALLTPDIHAAYAKAIENGAEPISDDGPVELPSLSGGVTAVKFRDPDGHPLEFLQKPGFGFAHSAISVGNVNRSVAFYSAIGVSLDTSQVNYGPEQDALDGLENTKLDVVALRPKRPSPHVELLCYRSPRAVPCHWSVRDICADRLVFAADAAGLRLMRDPDGHVVLLDGR